MALNKIFEVALNKPNRIKEGVLATSAPSFRYDSWKTKKNEAGIN